MHETESCGVGPNVPGKSDNGTLVYDTSTCLEDDFSLYFIE